MPARAARPPGDHGFVRDSCRAREARQTRVGLSGLRLVPTLWTPSRDRQNRQMRAGAHHGSPVRVTPGRDPAARAPLAYTLNGICRCDGRHTSQKKARKPPFASSKDRDRPDASPPPDRRDKRKALRRINPSAARPIAIKAQVPGSGAGAVFEITVAVNSPTSFRLKICPGAPRTRAPAVVASGIGLMQLPGKPRHEIERVSLNATSFFRS